MPEYSFDIEFVPEDIQIATECISDTIKPGVRVTLSNDKHGVIRYIGPTAISDGKPLIGVELDEDDPTAQDGTVGSKSYFNTTMGRGVFVRRASVVSIETTSVHEQRDGDESDEQKDDDSSEEEELDLDIGDYVELNVGVKGIVMYIGNTDFAKGEVIGLEMEKWDSDGHDGSKNGKRYFECKSGYGMWSRRDRIVRNLKVPPDDTNQDINKLSTEKDTVR